MVNRSETKMELRTSIKDLVNVDFDLVDSSPIPLYESPIKLIYMYNVYSKKVKEKYYIVRHYMD